MDMAWSYKTWYARNKASLLAKRRRKYRTDPTYKRQLIATSRRQYRSYRLKHPKVEDRRVMDTEDGERLLSIGMIAPIIRRSIQTVREYHANGVIPLPTHCDARGWRLYDRRQAAALVDAFNRFDRKELKRLSDVGKFLKERWTDGGEKRQEAEGSRGRRNRVGDKNRARGGGQDIFGEDPD